MTTSRRTSLVDSHVYPFPGYPSHSRHDDNEEETSLRRRLPIPDLRFEQTYLTRIHACLHIEPISEDPEDSEKKLVCSTVGSEEETAYVATTHVSPLVNSAQQVTRIDWGQVAYITLRDQVLMPLLQGILWGVVGTYYKPFASYAKGCLQGKPLRSRPVEGGGVSWLRSWAQKLGLSNFTVGPVSIQGRS
ncbi:hypothetical protein F5I97DRAFT_1936517 [Phlebopus sp. FC_14]|nr:hypothetical protein F5I97DRAFT_1936517 [Phlebopus sp. FC_14]